MKRLFLALVALAGLAGCSTDISDKYPEEALAPKRPAYHFDGPPSLTLITVRSNRTGSGGHTALMINADQRVIFDPAGSFHHPSIKREGDVLIGMDPAFYKAYKSMHARPTYNVLTQYVEVSPDVAQQALALALARGSVSDAQCALSTSGILNQLPGFSAIGTTFFPNKLSREFEAVTGAREEVLYEGYAPPGSQQGAQPDL